MSKVYALVVTSGETPYLPATLAALRNQTYIRAKNLIIDVSSAGVADRAGFTTLRTPGALNLGRALSAAVANPEFPQLQDEDLLWILHDDSAPAQDCLEHLYNAYQNAKTVAIVGPKQCSWDKKELLLEVGIKATGAARRLTEIDDQEIDQGQFDHREDVLAVGSAGMLIRWSVFKELGGFDPNLGPFGDGLELCRRVRQAAWRVVVAPKAVIYHKQAGFWGLRGHDGGRPSRQSKSRKLSETGQLLPDAKASFRRRRSAQLYNWLLAAPWWSWWLLLPFWIALLAPFRAVGRLITKELRLAAAEISSVLQVLTRPWLVYQGRNRIRRHQKLPRKALRPLQIKASQIRHARRTARRIAKDKRRPSPLEKTAAQNLRTDLVLERTLLILTGVTVTFAAVYVWRNILSGAGFGALPQSHYSLSDFWHYLSSGWMPVGDGYDPLTPGLDLLGVLYALWTNLLDLFGLNAAVLAIIFTPLVSFLSMFWATGVVSRRFSGRFSVALVWSLLPALWISLAAGDLPTLTVWVFLPIFFGSLLRAAHLNAPRVVRSSTGPVLVQSRPMGISQVGLAALSLMMLSSAVALFAPLGFLFIIAVRLRCSSLKGRLWLLFTPALLSFLPALFAAINGFSKGYWRVLFTSLAAPTSLDPGRSFASGIMASLGVPVSLENLGINLSSGNWLPPWAGYVFVLPTAVLLIFAIFALFRLDQRSAGVRLAWIVALIGASMSVFCTTFSVQLFNGGAYGAWPGTWIGLYLAGLLMAIVCATEPTTHDLLYPIQTWKAQLASATATSARILIVVSVLAAFFPWPIQNHADPLHEQFLVGSTNSDNVPTIARTLTDSEGRALALRIVSGPAGSALIETELWNAGPNSVFDVTALSKVRNYLQLRAKGGKPADKAQDALTQTVASLTVGNTPNLKEKLDQHAISHIVLFPSGSQFESMRQSIENSLDSLSQLQRTAATDSASVWRVGDQPVGEYRIGQLSWKAGKGRWDENSDYRSLTVKDGYFHYEPEENGEVLVIAARRSANFSAKCAGKELSVLEDENSWQQIFVLPNKPCSGRVTYSNFINQVWLVALSFSVLIAIGAAIPIKRPGGQSV